jgi:glycosyltransferase involved in cell wall biosynthesis
VIRPRYEAFGYSGLTKSQLDDRQRVIDPADERRIDSVRLELGLSQVLMRPTVSVIVPTYNRRALLAEAVASIHQQTYPAWELFIIDDGSTDGTAASVPVDARIRFVPRPHTGNVAALRNAGLAAATGAYVAFLDSDDIWTRSHLEQLVACLDAHPDCGWCYGDYQLVNAEGQELAKHGERWQPRTGRFVQELLTTEIGIPLQAILVRRSLAQRLKFDHRVPWGDDYDFLVRLACSTDASVVDAVVAQVREHPLRGNKARHDFTLYAGLAYLRYCRDLFAGNRPLQRICLTRAWSCFRTYLAHERAARGTVSMFRTLLRLLTNGLGRSAAEKSGRP